VIKELQRIAQETYFISRALFGWADRPAWNVFVATWYLTLWDGRNVLDQQSRRKG